MLTMGALDVQEDAQPPQHSPIMWPETPAIHESTSLLLDRVELLIEHPGVHELFSGAIGGPESPGTRYAASLREPKFLPEPIW